VAQRAKYGGVMFELNPRQKYTENDLKDAVHRVTGWDVEQQMKGGGFMPRLLTNFSSWAWIHKVADNTDTDLIRMALKDLEEFGCFNYY
jgi:hypothetical protein